MPVRKIPKNHLFVTGGFASAKADRLIGFESLLEKEYMMLLEFDENVASFEEQAVRIPVPGVPSGYVVDLRVRFRQPCRQIELVEVKPLALLDRYADEYAAKFAAAEAYCAERDWIFVKRTEQDIRTPRLQNLKFLRRYRNAVVSGNERSAVFSAMNRAGGASSSEALLAALGSDEREAWLPVIWHMVLHRELLTDMDVAMPVDVPLRLPAYPT